MSNTADIVDIRSFSYEKVPLQESSSGSGLKVRGILQRANAKNENGRVYPKQVLQREVKKFRKNKINERRSLGELDHPDSETINLKNVSHMITDIGWEGNDVVGEVKVLDTPNGQILQALFEDNVNVGISSRGMGSVHEKANGTLKVGNDFSLITWDFVSDPSTHGAYMEEINENKNLIRENAKRVRENKWGDVNNLVTNIISDMSDEYQP